MGQTNKPSVFWYIFMYTDCTSGQEIIYHVDMIAGMNIGYPLHLRYLHLFTTKCDKPNKNLYHTKNVFNKFRPTHFALQMNREWILMLLLKGYVYNHIS